MNYISNISPHLVCSNDIVSPNNYNLIWYRSPFSKLYWKIVANKKCFISKTFPNTLVFKFKINLLKKKIIDRVQQRNVAALHLRNNIITLCTSIPKKFHCLQPTARRTCHGRVSLMDNYVCSTALQVLPVLQPIWPVLTDLRCPVRHVRSVPVTVVANLTHKITRGPHQIRTFLGLKFRSVQLSEIRTIKNIIEHLCVGGQWSRRWRPLSDLQWITD